MTFHLNKALMLLVSFLSIVLFVHGDEEDDDPLNIMRLANEPLFVSLGSSCDSAHMVRFCEMRRTAFPLDWIFSFDGETLIEMLADDFCHFINDDDLEIRNATLVNTYYHLVFIHEGGWSSLQTPSKMEIFKSKYHRRIERFKQLSTYPGKVFFIRSAFWDSNNPNNHFRFTDNVIIADDYAVRLFDALKKRFPSLNFSLIIMNHCGEREPGVRRLSKDLIMFQDGAYLSLEDKIVWYKKFYNQIILDEAASELISQ